VLISKILIILTVKKKKSFRKISDKMTEDRAKKIYDQEMKVEQDYYEYLTGKEI